MKRWAVLTVALYIIALLLLTAPVFLVAFAGWAKHSASFTELRDLYSWAGYWIWLGVLGAGQALLLLVPIDSSERRLPARRKIRIPIAVAGFFMALLLCSAILGVACDFYKDNFLPNDNTTIGILLSSSLVATWVMWTMVFRRFARTDKPHLLTLRIVRWLLAGSILEFLVAVPSHIIVRRRDDCCAPYVTFWGIMTGLSVMLMCFGPGVFYLFEERFKRLRPKSKTASGRTV